MRNRYKGICFRCGKRVAPGDGEVISVDYDMREAWAPHGYRYPLSGDLAVQHDACAEKFAGTMTHYHWLPEGA